MMYYMMIHNSWTCATDGRDRNYLGIYKLISRFVFPNFPEQMTLSSNNFSRYNYFVL